MNVLLECFTDTFPDSGQLDLSSGKNSPTVENTLSSLNLTSSDCQEEIVGSPKKKQKYDDAGTSYIILGFIEVDCLQSYVKC